MANDNSLLKEMLLGELMAGKTELQIARDNHLPLKDVERYIDELLNDTVDDTDPEKMRKLHYMRLNKLVAVLWDRVIKNPNHNDYKNLRETLKDIQELLALSKERDAKHMAMMVEYQASLYTRTLAQLIQAFKELAPNALEHDEWEEWTAKQLEAVRDEFTDN